MLTEGEKRVVRQHLAKVIASSEFARSEKAAALLRFIVAQALNNDGDSLKERAIGISVFSREPDWDPKLDTTVRTEARRVRKKLDEYYLSAAAQGEPVRIEVPVGGYSPHFTLDKSTLPTARDGELHPLHAASEAFPSGNDPKSTESSAKSDIPVVTARNRHGWTLLIASLSVLCLAAVAAMKWGQTSAHSQSFQTVPLTSEFGQAMHPSISPDASQVAYVWDRGDGQNHIYLQSIAGGTPRRLTTNATTELDPAWSPHGGKLAFLKLDGSSLDIVVHDFASGGEAKIGTIASQMGDWTGAPGPLLGELGPSWFPDEDAIVVSDTFPHSARTGLVKIRVADGSRQQLTSTQGSIEDFIPKVSPDGAAVAFVRAISHGISDVEILDLKTGVVKQATNDAHSVNGISWSNDARSIVFSSNRQGPYQLWKLSVSQGHLERIDTNSANAIDPQIARTGEWIAFVTRNENWNIGRLSLLKPGESGSPPERFIASSGRNHSAQFAPDGRHIAFVSDRSGSWEIWLCDRDCTDPKRLTDFGGPWLGGLSWSPDSKELAFDARLGRNSAIYHMSIASSAPLLFEQNAFEERMPVWSMDGSAIYFNSDRDGATAIWKRDLRNGTLRKMGEGFVAREVDQKGDLLIGHSDGTIWSLRVSEMAEDLLSEEMTVHPVLGWTVYNGQVYYCSEGSNASVRVFDPTSRTTKLLATLPGAFPHNSASLAVSPDGRFLLVTTVDHSDGNIYRRIGPF